ncbi:hypothetical protein Y027_4691 [Burkholderia pseudomallei TSV5]|nr:hypothetical protein Y027_4691 [Burkholderia pseudomallei TSV5]
MLVQWRLARHQRPLRLLSAPPRCSLFLGIWRITLVLLAPCCCSTMLHMLFHFGSNRPFSKYSASCAQGACRRRRQFTPELQAFPLIFTLVTKLKFSKLGSSRRVPPTWILCAI